MKWTRSSCQSMKANAVRLQLHALAYNLANFLRTLALPPTPRPSRISIGHFPFRVAQLRDARARGGKLAGGRVPGFIPRGR